MTNLATVNDREEHKWIGKEFSKDKYSYEGDTNPGDPKNWTNLWVGGEYDKATGQWKWASGEEWGKDGFNGVGKNDPGIRDGKGTDNESSGYYINKEQRSKLLAHFNHDKSLNNHTRHGEGEGTYYWDATTGASNNTRGIAEVPLCK